MNAPSVGMGMPDGFAVKKAEEATQHFSRFRFNS